MINQIDVFRNKLETPTTEELKQVCCKACYTAQGEKCVCKCHGAYHGLGDLNRANHKRKHAKIDPNDKLLPEDEAETFRKQYDPKRTRCHCGCDLSQEPIAYYAPHPDGWTVKGEEAKVWLFVKCPSCGYEKSLWKMGVLRE